MEEFPSVWQAADVAALALQRLGRSEEAEQLYSDSWDTMQPWPPARARVPEKVHASTLAWLRLQHAAGNDSQPEHALYMCGGADTCDALMPPPAPSGGGAAGGWHRTSTAVGESELYSNRCNIPRRVANNFSKAEFIAEFVDLNRPVLIQGGMVGWAALDEGRWSREGLLAAFKGKVVQVRRSSQVVTDAAFDGDGSSAMSFDAYVEQHMGQQAQHVPGEGAEGAQVLGDPWYMFTQNPLASIHDDYTAPAYFDDTDDTVFSYNAAERAKTALFFVGPRGSGVTFHQHSNAWNALAFGQKRWFLLPPLGMHGPTSLPMATWLKERYPAMRRDVFECVQHAGDIVYVPTNWYHGVLNLHDSVGIAVEVGPRKQLLGKLLGKPPREPSRAKKENMMTGTKKKKKKKRKKKKMKKQP